MACPPPVPLVRPVGPWAAVAAPGRDGAVPVSGVSANVCPPVTPAPAAADPSQPAAESPSTAAVFPHTLAGAVTGALTWLPPAADRLPEVAEAEPALVLPLPLLPFWPSRPSRPSRPPRPSWPPRPLWPPSDPGARPRPLTWLPP